MLRTLWRTSLWLGGIVFFLAVLAGIAGYQIWSRSDQLLHQALLDGVRKWAPDLKVELGQCQLDWMGQVRLDQFSLTLPDQAEPLISLPEVRIDLNRDALLRRQEVVVENVRIMRPKLEVTHNADGTWCFDKLPKLPAGGGASLPSIQLEQAQVLLRWFGPEVERPVEVHLDGINIKLMPNGRRHLLVEGSLDVQQVGRLNIEGRIGIDSRTGTISGKLAGVEFDRELLKFASGFEPRIAGHVASIEQKLRTEMLREPDPRANSPFSITGIARGENASVIQATSGQRTTIAAAAVSTPLPTGATAHQIPASWIGAENSVLGLHALLDVAFRIHIAEEGATPDVRLLMDITGGEVTNTVLPFPLNGLTGQIECSAQQIVVRRLSASNGPTLIELTADVRRTPSGPRGQSHLKVTSVSCDDRLRSRLSAGFGRIYDQNHPAGLLDMEGSVASNKEGRWIPQGLTVTAKKCAVMHDLFPYPVRDAVGTIRLEDRDLVVDMLGRAGERPISLKGRVRNPGPEAHMFFEIDVQDLPLDRQFFAACPPKLQNTLASMQLRGRTDAHWTMSKAGSQAPLVLKLSGDLHDGQMAFTGFPYPVDRLSGHLEFDGRNWEFTKLNGMHGNATLFADGSYITRGDSPGLLTLNITTENAPLDQSLYAALPKNLQGLWDEFQLSGLIRRSVTKVEWAGSQSRISLPEFHLVGTRMKLKSLPYELRDIAMAGDFADGKVTVRSFDGHHDRTFVKANGEAEIQPNGDWRVRLERCAVTGLLPNAELMTALNSNLRKVFAAFDPQHRIDLNGWLELKGTPDPRLPVTAAWDIVTDVSGSSLDIGLLAQDAHGRIRSRGVWDGQTAKADGQLDLSTLIVLDRYRLTELRGPFRIRDGVATCGSASVLKPESADVAVPSEQQITAKFIGGLILVNAQATLDSPSRYLVHLRMAHASLERYAQQYMGSRDRLQGVMNGYVLLAGRGPGTKSLTGQGQLQVSPAALYEMPVIFQVLNTLTVAPRDNSFFEYARIDFNIANERFNFGAIDLVGKPMQLRGRGTAGFDGSLDLKFVSLSSQSAKNGPRIPVVSEVAGLVGGVTSLAGVVVEVTGTKDAPRTRVVPVATLDDAFRRFVETLTPQPLTPPALPRLPGF